MLSVVFPFLVFLTYVRSLPLDPSTTDIAQTSATSLGLHLTQPPAEFFLTSLDGSKPFSVEVGQASHICINLIIEGWLPSGPPIPAVAHFDDPSFNLRFVTKLNPGYQKKYGNLRTPAWVALGLVEAQLGDMEPNQMMWDFPTYGYLIGKPSSRIGTCVIKPKLALDEETVNTTSTIDGQESGNSTGFVADGSSVEGNTVYQVQYYDKGQTVPRKSMVWLLWSYLDVVLRSDAFDTVSSRYKAKGTYVSEPFDGVQLKVTYTRVIVARHVVKFIDVMHSLRFIFKYLADQPKWQTFDAIASFENVPGSFLKIEVSLANGASAIGFPNTSVDSVS